MTAAVREVGIEEGIRLAAEGATVIDVREKAEWDTGHVPGALLLPIGECAQRIGDVVPDRSTPLVLHCAVGARSGRAAVQLAALGYTNVVTVAADIRQWAPSGGPWEVGGGGLTDAQRRRYNRQMLIPEVGVEGQQRLLHAKVLLIGAGGLGSPAGLYLAAAGVGTIGLVDDDVVDESNLQRQILHTADRIGVKKIDSARATIGALNPETRIVGHDERLNAENVERLIAGYDVILDGTDNFDTRYVLNDAAVKLRKPVVHGSVYRFDGQVTTFIPFEGPCYRCMYPTMPPPELAPACDVAGVLGVLPGLIGILQATEVIKLVLKIGEPLAGRLLMVDALNTEFSEVKVWRDPACPACGEGSQL
ncbi:MAG: molybdopterin-synthase adenylyltransferase MoeB [Chloroflexota bacterium]|nr:molybdopterin-synthase adenylyltransferase MoeB [Chloroflexota bacterium]